MKDSFSGFHPAVNFSFFGLALIFSMFFMHPILALISFCASFLYSVYLKGKKAVKFNLLISFPVLILMVVVNALTGGRGSTVLLYVNDIPITYEAILFSLGTGVMFLSVIFWFSCYNEIMSSDKFIYLFGKIIPSISLIFSMTLRLVPKFKEQAKTISLAQKCIGKDVSNGNVLNKIKNAGTILSILMTWALESAIETADSMKCRGYGVQGRTTFSNYYFRLRDFIAVLVLFISAMVIITGGITKRFFVNYYPVFQMNEISAVSFTIYLVYGILMFLPLIINVMEDLKWMHYKSKI